MNNNNWESIKEQLKSRLYDYVLKITEPSREKNKFVCPICGSGTGTNKTGAFHCEPESTEWHCFSCGRHGDIYNLVRELENINSLPEQIKYVANFFNEALPEGNQPMYMKKSINRTHKEFSNISINQQTKVETGEDYTEYFNSAHSHIAETNYPQQRGLSEEVINKFNLGYVAEWQHPKAPSSPTSPRLIIPTSKYSYLARDIRAEVPEEEKSYTKSKVGHTHLFNIQAIHSANQPIFIVEGEIDALSIIEAGGEAVALGSVNMVTKFLEYIRTHGKPVQPIILSLDNDEHGQEAQKKLLSGILEIDSNIECSEFNISEPYKDPNERLQKDREGLGKDIVEHRQVIQEQQNGEQSRYLEDYSAFHYLSEFVYGITSSVDTPYISTGFTTLDYVLDNGLYEGLYVIGAISSLGKTTFVLQMTDQIARSGQDVLIFALEMARSELMAKSISRSTVELACQRHLPFSNAKTTRGITDRKRYDNYSEVERQLVFDAINDYGTYSEHIFIIEGMGNIGVAEVREQIEKHIRITGNKPVVVIDYVQILAPYNEKATDKQNVDKNVLELKRITRDFKLPLIAVSSFNRASYSQSVAMEAFKESGALEYGCDVLFGLQLAGVKDKSFDVNAAKSREPRDVELVVLKNRNGRTGDTIKYFYYPKFNRFTEQTCYDKNGKLYDKLGMDYDGKIRK